MVAILKGDFAGGIKWFTNICDTYSWHFVLGSVFNGFFGYSSYNGLCDHWAISWSSVVSKYDNSFVHDSAFFPAAGRGREGVV